MQELIFITGGARSGKSRYAEECLKTFSGVIYIATAIPYDDEMVERIRKHKERRAPGWVTIEKYEGLAAEIASRAENKEAILLDCLTLLITNLMFRENDVNWDTVKQTDVDRIEKKIESEINSILKFIRNFPGKSIIVSNELGMGLVPEYPLGRYFRDIAGRINQKVAAAADKVLLMISGIPIKIKG